MVLFDSSVIDEYGFAVDKCSIFIVLQINKFLERNQIFTGSDPPQTTLSRPNTKTVTQNML